MRITQRSERLDAMVVGGQVVVDVGRPCRAASTVDERSALAAVELEACSTPGWPVWWELSSPA